jgi:hypothetical protein
VQFRETSFFSYDNAIIFIRYPPVRVIYEDKKWSIQQKAERIVALFGKNQRIKFFRQLLTDSASQRAELTRRECLVASKAMCFFALFQMQPKEDQRGLETKPWVTKKSNAAIGGYWCARFDCFPAGACFFRPLGEKGLSDTAPNRLESKKNKTST